MSTRATTRTKLLRVTRITNRTGFPFPSLEVHWVNRNGAPRRGTRYLKTPPQGIRGCIGQGVATEQGSLFDTYVLPKSIFTWCRTDPQSHPVLAQCNCVLSADAMACR